MFRRFDVSRDGVYFLLVMMGLATFAPCVLLPEWRKYQALDLVAQAEQHRLDALTQEVDRQRELLTALSRDPAVVARLAQRELHYRPSGTQAVRVSAPIVLPNDELPFRPVPVSPPVAVVRMASFLPAYDWDRVFCDDEVRPVLMIMSIALIAVAFALFPPHVCRTEDRSPGLRRLPQNRLHG